MGEILRKKLLEAGIDTTEGILVDTDQNEQEVHDGGLQERREGSEGQERQQDDQGSEEPGDGRVHADQEGQRTEEEQRLQEEVDETETLLREAEESGTAPALTAKLRKKLTSLNQEVDSVRQSGEQMRAMLEVFQSQQRLLERTIPEREQKPVEEEPEPDPYEEPEKYRAFVQKQAREAAKQEIEEALRPYRAEQVYNNASKQLEMMEGHYAGKNNSYLSDKGAYLQLFRALNPRVDEYTARLEVNRQILVSAAQAAEQGKDPMLVVHSIMRDSVAAVGKVQKPSVSQRKPVEKDEARLRSLGSTGGTPATSFSNEREEIDKLTPEQIRGMPTSRAAKLALDVTRNPRKYQGVDGKKLLALAEASSKV